MHIFFIDQDRVRQNERERDKYCTSFQLKYLKITRIEHLSFLCPFNSPTSTKIKIRDENQCNKINTVILYLNTFTFKCWNGGNNLNTAHLGPSFQVWVVSIVLAEPSRTLQLSPLKAPALCVSNLSPPFLSDWLTVTLTGGFLMKENGFISKGFCSPWRVISTELDMSVLQTT